MKLAINVNLKLSDKFQRYYLLGLALWTSVSITQTAYVLKFCLYLADKKKTTTYLSLCSARKNVNAELLYMVGKYFSKIYFQVCCFLSAK